MNLRESRFADNIGPHCPATRCTDDVIMCMSSSAGFLVDADPSAEGTYKISDTGGSQPYAALTQPAARFGLQGKLHRRHTTYCPEYAKVKNRG